MKSLFISLFTTVCLLANQALASETIDYMNIKEILDLYQIENNNAAQTNNNIIQEDNIVTDNSNQYNNALNNISNNDNVINEPVDTIPTANTYFNYNSNINEPNLQTVNEALPGFEEKNDGSNNTAYILGGVGFTSVAFIAAFGYKNFRKTTEFNRIKEEFLEEGDGIAKPEKAKRSNTLTRLSRSLSLSFINKDDDYIDNKPVVSESLYSNNYSLTKNRAYKCHVAWTPLVSDEIILRRGDLVCVKESYSDGYSLGRNLSTKFDGIFPTCCLSSPSNQIMGSELIKNGKFVSILKRSSSKNKAKRSRRASSVSVVLPSWIQKTELNSILTQ